MHRRSAGHTRRIGVVGAVAAGSLLLGSGVAIAEPTEDEVRERYEELQEEFSELENAYLEAHEDHDAAVTRLAAIEEELETVEGALGDLHGTVRSLATAAYTGPVFEMTGIMLADGSGGDQLEGIADLNYLADREQEQLLDYLDERERLEGLHLEAESTEEIAADALDTADQAREDGEAAVAEQADLLDQFAEADTTSDTETEPVQNDSSSPSSGDSGGGSSNAAVSGDVQAVLDFARAQIGKPYVWGGTGPNGYDCSGLTQAAWSQAGVSLPRVSQDQWNFGTRVGRGDLQPGDLLFFYNSSAPTHVGLYSGNGRMIHGSNPRKPIEEVSLAAYWDGVFVGAVRPA